MAATPYSRSPSFLLSQLGAVMARRFAEAIVATGLSPRAFGVLSNIAELGPRTQQQLADELGMHRNNMVTLIDELEAHGWARRVRNRADRRAFDITLSAAGRRVLERAARVVPDLDAELSAGLTAEERRHLVALLSKLADTADLTPGVHPHLAARH